MEQEYRVPADITVVQKTALKPDVRTVVIHSKVTNIAADAFRDWENLSRVVFERKSRVERIGAHAFAGTALEQFVAPRSLKTIRGGAFAGCRNLKEVRLNEGLESITGAGDGAFLDSGLKTVYLPSTL